MRIAVTGGTGRVGRAVIGEALAGGHEVVSLDRVEPELATLPAGVQYHQVDTTDHADLLAGIRGADALIHLAAYPGPHRHPDHEVHNNNVVSSYNALSAAVELGIRRVCQASSINATGAAYSRWPRYDYLPLDELHPTYAEDPYSLSKWICEEQGDCFARLHADLSIASMRFHGVVESREVAIERLATGAALPKHLWGYTRADAAARACLASLTADFGGHEAFYIVAPRTMMPGHQTSQLVATNYPDVPLRRSLRGDEGLYDCSKAERLLGWQHPAT
ncbi:MAG: NAD(P)-dependent oxidoreductase [Candidatus Dormibacteraeota bacterium]|nr:NAD(P)-dependent oxidoreductase [Candidatus Dormibacteraeota bacterium]